MNLIGLHTKLPFLEEKFILKKKRDLRLKKMRIFSLFTDPKSMKKRMNFYDLFFRFRIIANYYNTIIDRDSSLIKYFLKN